MVMDAEVIVVAVDATKEITDYALEWAVRNVVKPNDSLIFLAIILPHHSTTHKFLSYLMRKWGIGHKEGQGKIEQELLRRVNNVCEHMMKQQLEKHVQVVGEVNVVANARLGAVVAKAAQLGANWVILDGCLKKEGECCLKQLDCNIVLMDHAIPKVVRHAAKRISMVGQQVNEIVPDEDNVAMTPRSSVGLESARASRRDREQSNYISSNSFLLSSSQRFYKEVPDRHRKTSSFDGNDPPRTSSSTSSDWKIKSYSGSFKIQSDMNEGYNSSFKDTQISSVPARRSTGSQPKQVMKKRCSFSRDKFTIPTIDDTSSIRKAIYTATKQEPTPPPLCYICSHKSGKSPRRFTHKEILQATNAFSTANFIAGGHGAVYKGVLIDGQVVAVKQRNAWSAQEASEFCSEVEVLSCAQHKNLVMLVGYCIEKEWLLVYEYACNGSLDKHLYGTERNEVMCWDKRMKVATGAARGLRYLHEDCRVGCIVHRDLRPNNILLTHDFEPMVGDFGLARWPSDGQFGEEKRALRSFGYVAPEYTRTGIITDKANVYSFGVVLLELLSGFRATDFSKSTGQEFVAEWACPLVERKMMEEIIDPRLEDKYERKEVECMMYAASLCVSRHPQKRPSISKVLKILEGDMGSMSVQATYEGRRPVKSCTKHGVVSTFQQSQVNMEGSVAKFIQNTTHNYK